ncbi:MAG: hypothetical protein R3247_17205 [Rhodothermales bacterium]|nr:hypothetical protein [Rhodothermales bacterium]
MTIRLTGLLCLLALLLGVASAQAQTPPPDAIGFVYLRLEDDAVMLERTAVQPGRLKPQRGLAHLLRPGLYYEATGPDGAVLWEGWIADPRDHAGEWATEDGRLHALPERPGAAALVVRVPAGPDVRGLRLFAAEPVRDAAGKQTVVRRLLGAVPLSF